MRYLIINPFGIGDVLFTTPLARAVKTSREGVFLGYWCNRRVEEILKANKYIDKTFSCSRGDLKKDFKTSFVRGLRVLLGLIKEIRKSRFDAAIDLSLDHRYALIASLCGIKMRFGYDFKGRGRLLTDKTLLKGYRGRHVIDFYSALLERIGVPEKGKSMDLFLKAPDLEEADKLLKVAGVRQGDLIIGISPGGGGSWGGQAYLKYWQEEKFAGLSDRLISGLGAKVVFLGDESDFAVISGISGLMKEQAVNAAGKTSLGTLAALISKLNLLISNDSGILHMASALRVKTVSFFGPTDDLVYGPYPDKDSHIVLKQDISCRPCYNDFRLDECLRDKECLKGISVETAYEAAKRLLGGNKAYSV